MIQVQISEALLREMLTQGTVMAPTRVVEGLDGHETLVESHVTRTGLVLIFDDGSDEFTTQEVTCETLEGYMSAGTFNELNNTGDETDVESVG